jgi:magnesium transporter
MIKAYRISGNGLVADEGDGGGRDGGGGTGLAHAVWIDMLEPSDAERMQVSGLIGVELPSRADQEEIEQSSRLYIEHGAPVMTVLLPSRTTDNATQIGPVTFILAPDRLVTVRHHSPRPFETYPPRAGKSALGCHNVEQLMLGLVEDVIDRLADITEQAGRDIDALSKTVFQPEAAIKTDLQSVLRQIGVKDTMIMHLRESLLTMERMLGFLIPVMDARKSAGRELRGMVKTQLRDVHTIAEQAGFLVQKTGLLLEATLGLINIEQSGIIKIFSVAAVVFLPPTLIASIYGMNFAHMPELDKWYGYPMALGAMVLSAIVPLIYFKRKGWF